MEPPVAPWLQTQLTEDMMKITRRQLRRIIKEEKRRLLNEHAYDAAKEEAAHYGTETDAIWEILGDLEDIGAPPALVATVEEAEQHEEDLSYVLSLIPVELKDKMI